MATNLPAPNIQDSAEATKLFFDQYGIGNLEYNANDVNSTIGFFESKGFDKSSSETISVTFIKQAKQDGYNPLSVLDSIKKLDTVTLNSLVTEILNFNRYKTSYLGSKFNLSPFEPVARNIVA